MRIEIIRCWQCKQRGFRCFCGQSSGEGVSFCREEVNYLLSRFSLTILYVKLTRTALDISSLSSVMRYGKMTSMVESRAGGVFSMASMWIVRYQGFERIH